MSFCEHVFDLGKRSRQFFVECLYCHGHRLKRHGREHVSLQTALLWKRKIQRIPENAGNKVLSGDVWVDHTYVNVPMSERRGRKKRGLSRELL